MKKLRDNLCRNNARESLAKMIHSNCANIIKHSEKTTGFSVFQSFFQILFFKSRKQLNISRNRAINVRIIFLMDITKSGNEEWGMRK